MEDNKNKEKDHDNFKPGADKAVDEDKQDKPKVMPAPQAPQPSIPEASKDFAGSRLDLTGLKQDVDHLKQEIQKYLIGQHEMLDLLLIGILADGHILLEGVPGIAKTLTSKLLAKTIDTEFSRIQFTPDLMPSDVIGTSVYNMKSGDFNFKEGPVFSNIILIDEINRAPAKTQSALFEVMEERQITVDGKQHTMSYPFMIVATQNPVEQEGTYRLPEAQLDRFLFRINLNYPTMTEEEDILKKFREAKTANINELRAILNPEKIRKYRALVDQVKVEDSIIRYIAQINHETRNHGKLFLGGSPRASLSMMHASKANAAMRNRDFVTPDDVQFVAPHVLNHRIILNPEAEMEGIRPEDIIQEIVHKVEVPR